MAHDTVRDNPHTRAIANFVSGLAYDDIPSDVRDRIKLLILDSLGCGLYGVDLEWTKIIRKTLGASSADIVRLLVGQFLRPVLIANLIAWPLAFVAMRTWLTGFDDRIALSPLFFVAASAVAIGIAVLTVLAQSLRASRAAPAWALRHE